ncbi:hypothetical protein GCM10023191_101730 [Actinoallomurus oryzae]|uniref:Uncharacterized protein n=1 Tax=Actinoallomurus oryzae TaxID=502180 RepID=A0ABP8R9J5_9ACTN
MSRSSRIRQRFYDPSGTRYGIPTYPWQLAPPHLLTRRQLAACSPPLRPGGQPIAAQVLWVSRRYAGHPRTRVAYLYDISLAKPKRTASPAQREAIAKAIAARRICRGCGVDRGYQPARRLGVCNDCAAKDGAAA